MSPDRTDIVCLCTHYDLKSLYATGFAHHPSLQLLQPEEVADPKAIDIALAFNPPPDAFARFPNLKLLHSVGAGVDGLLKHPGLLRVHHAHHGHARQQARMLQQTVDARPHRVQQL
ncbi:MAG: hypothetical protein AAFN05_08345, partial [Pseudomonadota bacterium]